MHPVKIYWLEDLNGVPFYVGQTINEKARFIDHKGYRKTDSFKLVVLDTVKKEQSHLIEALWIQLLYGWGFNLENRNYNALRSYKHAPINDARQKEIMRSLESSVALMKEVSCRKKTIKKFINDQLKQIQEA